MSSVVKFDVDIESKIFDEQMLTELCSDEQLRLQIHNLLAKMCDPYVPMQEGVLAQTTEITSEGVRYTQPYAHYQYVGMVYGPNIPIKDSDGFITGWFSPPGKKKHPTGRAINYSTEMHPLASKEWDKRMLQDKRDVFLQQVTELIQRRLRNGD